MTECVLIPDIGLDEYLTASLVDDWVENNLDTCSICQYYETEGELQHRLYAAIFNSEIIRLIKAGKAITELEDLK